MNHSSLSTNPNKFDVDKSMINDTVTVTVTVPTDQSDSYKGKEHDSVSNLKLEIKKKTTEGGMDKNKDKYITIDLQDNMRYSSKRCIETTPVSEDTFQYNNSHSFHDHERTTVASCVCE